MKPHVSSTGARDPPFTTITRSFSMNLAATLFILAAMVAAPQERNTPTAENLAAPVPAEPDFRVLNLPSTLRMPLHGSNFQLTHRFNGNLGRGSIGGNAGNLFGLDQG